MICVNRSWATHLEDDITKGEGEDEGVADLDVLGQITPAADGEAH